MKTKIVDVSEYRKAGVDIPGTDIVIDGGMAHVYKFERIHDDQVVYRFSGTVSHDEAKRILTDAGVVTPWEGR
jgi:hypothetical protein